MWRVLVYGCWWKPLMQTKKYYYYWWMLLYNSKKRGLKLFHMKFVQGWGQTSFNNTFGGPMCTYVSMNPLTMYPYHVGGRPFFGQVVCSSFDVSCPIGFCDHLPSISPSFFAHLFRTKVFFLTRKSCQNVTFVQKTRAKNVDEIDDRPPICKKEVM